MISFGIITDGEEPYKLLATIYSIYSLGQDVEIAVCGNVPEEWVDMWEWDDDFKVYQAPHLSANGRLGAMRNTLCKNAKHDRMVICDDDIFFHHGFLEGIPDFCLVSYGFRKAVEFLKGRVRLSFNYVAYQKRFNGVNKDKIFINFYTIDRFRKDFRAKSVKCRHE